MHKADWVLSGFCLRMRYRNRAQAHSLAWEALQLFGFSASLVDIPSKVAEVLAFVENVPRGQIRQTEPKPKATNRRWASGQWVSAIHNSDSRIETLVCGSFL